MEFAVAGAMFGAFITGWIYELARIFNRSLPVPVMALVYIFPYTVWILVVTGGLGGLIANIWQYTLGIGSAAVAAPEGSILSATLMSVFLGLVAVVNIFSWTMSLRGLYHVYTDETPDYIQIPPIEYGVHQAFCVCVRMAHRRGDYGFNTSKIYGEYWSRHPSMVNIWG